MQSETLSLFVMCQSEFNVLLFITIYFPTMPAFEIVWSLSCFHWLIIQRNSISWPVQVHSSQISFRQKILSIIFGWDFGPNGNWFISERTMMMWFESIQKNFIRSKRPIIYLFNSLIWENLPDVYWLQQLPLQHLFQPNLDTCFDVRDYRCRYSPLLYLRP